MLFVLEPSMTFFWPYDVVTIAVIYITIICDITLQSLSQV